MKRIFCSIVAASLMLAGFNANAQMSLGAGFLNSKSTTKIGSTTADAVTNGFYVGADYCMPIVAGLSMTPGLYYNFSTASDASSIGSIISAKGTTSEMYIGIPVNFSYAVNFTDGVKGFVFAGPTFNLGLSSTTKYSGNIAGFSAGKTVDYYKDSDYGRFEVMLGGGVGLEVSCIRLTVGYDMGINNRYTGDADNYSIKRNQLHAGIAYLF